MSTQTKPAMVSKQPKSARKLAKQSPGRIAKPVTLIYVPLHLGGPHKGVSMGPAAMKVAETTEKIEKLGFKVAREVDINVPQSVCWTEQRGELKCVPEILEVSQALAAAVEEALEQGNIPITIGGDHSLAIGSIAGVSSYFKKQKKEFGVIWFDAHGDINTPDTSHSGNVHGMPLAISLGTGDPRLVNMLGYTPKIDGSKVALIGLRDVDIPERDLIESHGITASTMEEIDHHGLGPILDHAMEVITPGISGLHVSFDIDVIDPDVAPGVSTPARGGLTYREAQHALTLIAESDLICSIDIAELNPAFDVRNSTAQLATELILSCLGKRII